MFLGKASARELSPNNTGFTAIGCEIKVILLDKGCTRLFGQTTASEICLYLLFWVGITKVGGVLQKASGATGVE